MSVNTHRQLFIKQFEAELRLFLPEEPFDHAVTAEKAGTPVPLGALISLLNTKLGQQLFQGEAQEAKWHNFISGIKKRLEILTHVDWIKGERDNFWQASKSAVTDLVATGFLVYDDYDITVPFFGVDYIVKVKSLNLAPKIMYQCALRQLLVNNGQVRALPWEAHLKEAFGGSFPNIPETIRLDEETVASLSGAREVALKATMGFPSYDSMCKELQRCKESIRSLDPFFYLEEDFFRFKLPKLAEDIVYGQIRDVLPDGKSDIVPEEHMLANIEFAYAKVTAIVGGALARHSEPSVGKSIQAVLLIIRAVMDGTSMGAKATLEISAFHKSIYDQCANYLVYEVLMPKPGEPRCHFGAAAMAKLYKDFTGRIKKSQSTPDRFG